MWLKSTSSPGRASGSGTWSSSAGRLRRSSWSSSSSTKLGLEPVVYDPRNTPALIAEIQKSPNPALIVGHSNTVPDIVAALGGARPGPLTHEDFGDIWHISGPQRL
jgi:hypothetical protein